jgi:TonB-linked SusC/RagA family outer membrane protein
MTKILKNLAMSLVGILLFGSLNQVFAQGREITGTVTGSDTKQPVAGVTVTVKGTKKAVATDANGHFKISVDNNATTLVFSSTGYAPMEVSIAGKTTANIEMLPEVKQLEDVVVIGYQTIKRKDVLASVSSISAKDLKDIPINSASEALNGRLAGVTATTSEGSPDATIRIRVRGGMSITGDNSPLFIIDGMQVDNGLNFISPQDIQSIDVLKDAAATAIYGARGANGVIIVTTKSGKAGKVKVSYNGYVGVRELANKLDVMSPYEYVIYQSERSRGSSTDSSTFTNNFGHTWDTLNVYKNIKSVDWQDEIMGRTGIDNSHNISLSGGNRIAVYTFGYTYNDQKAIVINSQYKRHLVNLKGEYNLTKHLKATLAGRYTNQNVWGAGTSDQKGSSYNRLRNAVKYRPFLSYGKELEDADPLADQNVGNGLNLYNPITLANAEYRRRTTEVFNITASASWDIVKNLNIKSTFGYDINTFTDRQFNDSITPYSIINGARKPTVELDTSIRKTLTNSNVILYTVNNWKNAHTFSILAGEETYDYWTENHFNLFKNYPNNITSSTAFKNTNLAVPFTGYPRLSKTRYTNLSFFGRISYSYKDRYLISANVRQDGASKFKPGKQWGIFPSGSVAWRVSKEKFMEPVKAINDLKFRVGYGKIGNNRIGDYLFLTTFANDGRYYYGINNTSVIAYYPTSLVNEKLKWEATVNRNYGMDLSMFKSRLNLSVDYYDNSSEDLLLFVPIASTYGYANQYQNVGKTSNKGFEVQLTATLVRKPNFTWNVSFNISTNKNKIIQLGPNQQSFPAFGYSGVSGQPSDYIVKVGQPVGSIYGLVTDGFYKVSDFDYNTATGIYKLKTGVVNDSAIIGVVQPGSIRFQDLNGDGYVDINNDRKIIGDPNPKFTGGLSQQFTYKNWDASLFINFSYGNDVYNANKIEFTNGYTANSNQLKIMEGRWKVVTATGQTAEWVNGNNVYGIPPDQLAALNANATIWQPLKSTGAFYPHSWAIEDGSFIRINNLTIGYKVPVKKLAGLKMSNLRFYATVNNLAIITNYSGYDPEVSVNGNPLTYGLDYSAYPKSRSYIFGVNASF